MYKFRDVNATKNESDVFSPDWESNDTTVIVVQNLHSLHGKVRHLFS